MEWAALVAWVATAFGGLALAAQWAHFGGLRQSEGIRWPRLLVHGLLAVAGLALWLVYALTESTAFAWLAVVLLVVVTAVGLSMFALWLRGKGGPEPTAMPAESAFPLPVVLLHGVLGTTTLVLSVIAALGVGV